MKSKSLYLITTLLLAALACGFPSAPADAPFNGTWSGSDPDDGSIITLSLTQSGNSLTGTFADTFSGSVTPGHQGLGSGTVESAATAEITFNLTRGDGQSATVSFRLTLSNQNNTITLDTDSGRPITLQK